MKKLFTLLTFLTITVYFSQVKAQLIFHNAVNHATGDTSNTLTTHVEVRNTSSDSVVIRVQRTNTSLSNGHDTYFCWGQTCYTPATSLSAAFVLEPAGDSLGRDSATLIVYAECYGTFGTDSVNCIVYDTAHANSDRLSLNFTFDFTVTGINVFKKPSPGYLNCSESDFGDATNVSYSINNFRNGKLVVRNLLGSVVKAINLSEKQGTLSVSTAEFPSGIYMYFLYNNDEPIATKKMVVSH